MITKDQLEKLEFLTLSACAARVAFVRVQDGTAYEMTLSRARKQFNEAAKKLKDYQEELKNANHDWRFPAISYLYGLREQLPWVAKQRNVDALIDRLSDETLPDFKPKLQPIPPKKLPATVEEIAQISAATVVSNQDTFVAHWVLQNPDKNLNDYELVTIQGAEVIGQEHKYVTSFLIRLKESPGECKFPPEGWYCTRPAGHTGPCAAYAKEEK